MPQKSRAPKKSKTSKKSKTPTRSKAPKSKNWIVTTSPDRPIKTIAKDLEKAGFSIGRVNGEIQSISGAAGDNVAKKLRSISGVVDVSADEPVDVGPPDSTDTW